MPEDIAIIAADARPADVAECEAMGTTVEDGLRQGLECSDWTLTGLVDGVPVCMFGVACHNVLLGIGRPWMLGIRGVDRHQRLFVRHCRQPVEYMRSRYRALVNCVDARNTTAIRWLRWLGFEIGPESFPMGGTTFTIFKMGAT